VLVLTHGVSEAIYLSARNLPRVDVLPYSDASAYDVLWADVVVVEEPALSDEPAQPYVRPFVPAPKGEGRVVGERAPKKTAAKAAKAAKAEKKAEKKTAKPKATKKAAPKVKAAVKKPADKKATSKKKGGK
jgi:hypothetical protein